MLEKLRRYLCNARLKLASYWERERPRSHKEEKRMAMRT